MKTTLVIDDAVMRDLKARALVEEHTISALVEMALRSFLRQRALPSDELESLPVFDLGGALVNVADREALEQAMTE